MKIDPLYKWELVRLVLDIGASTELKDRKLRLRVRAVVSAVKAWEKEFARQARVRKAKAKKNSRERRRREKEDKRLIAQYKKQAEAEDKRRSAFILKYGDNAIETIGGIPVRLEETWEELRKGA